MFNCYSSCPLNASLHTYHVASSFQCRTTCPADYPYQNNSFCISACPTNYFFTVNSTLQQQLNCQSTCSMFVYVINATTEQCISSCPASVPLAQIQSNFGQSNMRVCVALCNVTNYTNGLQYSN